MRKLAFYLLALMAFVACSDSGLDDVGENSDNEQPKVPAITLNATEANFTVDGGSTSVTFTSSSAWTAEVTNADGWCGVSPTKGSAGNVEITITAKANDITDARTATVVIKSGVTEKTITVSQNQKDAIVIAENSYTMDGDGGEIEIEVGHNIEFDIEIDGDWITLVQTRALETSKLIFVIEENDTTVERSGSITFTSKDGAISQKIIVMQECKIPNNQIWYTSRDSKIVTPYPYSADGFDASIVSNVYEKGKGVITFDGDITSIGERVFYDCGSLTSITIPDSVTSIGYDAFCHCYNLTNITISNGVTSIGDRAFYGCYSWTSVTIPDSVTEIGSEAFYECGSISITIPDSVTSIGCGAFKHCWSLTSFYGKFASADNRCLIVDGLLNSFAPAGLTTYTIPDSVTSIGEDAFGNCSSLISITIPDSVTSIGCGAFFACSSLASVTIPDSVTSIGEDAFRNCRSLTSITIPDSATSIGRGAFLRCRSLISFYGKFASADNRCLIIDGVLNSFASAGLTTYTIPDHVTSIGDWVFCDCENLTSITIPDSVTLIGSQAFDYCNNLISVYCKPTTPPTLGNSSSVFDYNASGRRIYVPTASVDAYKSAVGWSKYKNDIVGYDF